MRGQGVGCRWLGGQRVREARLCLKTMISVVVSTRCARGLPGLCTQWPHLRHCARHRVCDPRFPVITLAADGVLKLASLLPTTLGCPCLLAVPSAGGGQVACPNGPGFALSECARDGATQAPCEHSDVGAAHPDFAVADADLMVAHLRAHGDAVQRSLPFRTESSTGLQRVSVHAPSPMRQERVIPAAPAAPPLKRHRAPGRWRPKASRE